MRSPRPALGDRELDQAQQRAVAALAHELGVEREPPGRAGAVGELAECRLVHAGAHPRAEREGATLGGSWPRRLPARRAAQTGPMSRGSVCPAAAAAR